MEEEEVVPRAGSYVNGAALSVSSVAYTDIATKEELRQLSTESQRTETFAPLVPQA